MARIFFKWSVEVSDKISGTTIEGVKLQLQVAEDSKYSSNFKYETLTFLCWAWMILFQIALIKIPFIFRKTTAYLFNIMCSSFLMFQVVSLKPWHHNVAVRNTQKGNNEGP